MLSISDILNVISDDKALVLFRTIALANYRSDTLRSKTKLTRKQFYSQISNLIRIGLVKRKGGKYSLTAYGRVIYNVQEVIGVALEDYWKLKVIDSIELSDKEFSKEEYAKIIDSLIDNKKIKDFLAK